MKANIEWAEELPESGLTRAKKLAIIIGSQKAIGMCVRSTKSQERYTRLQQRLQAALQ
jgi:exodeoxyribonuclease V alpha subunit